MEIAKELLRKLTVTSMNRDASSSQQHRICDVSKCSECNEACYSCTI